MFRKIALITVAIWSMAIVGANAQQLFVETTTGDLISENLDSVQHLTFPNQNLVISKSDASTRSFSLLTVKKLYFGVVSATDEASLAEQITGYPNPTQDFFYLKNLPARETDLFLFSIQGTRLLKTKVSASSNKINVSHLPSGLYFIKINDQTLKFVKQ